MAAMPENSVDAIVCDPPYGLEFMGKEWDGSDGFRRSLNVADAGRKNVFGRTSKKGPEYRAGGLFQKFSEAWATEALRVLKPGGHLLAFGGTRTHHRMVSAVEDAGFEIRDCVMWIYGSGFPKSHNLKGERQGWGTALKPAYEPIVVARKPLSGTVAENVQAYGTGAINIDGCRVPGEGGKYRTNEPSQESVYTDKGSTNFAMKPGPRGGSPDGRWPANVIHDGSEEVLETFPDAPGQQGDLLGHNSDRESPNGIYGKFAPANDRLKRNDSGSSARFFYCAKTSKAERGEGNTHPTVKPAALMQYLCRLVTPPNGLVLDPFMGSGSTGMAALREGFRFIGVDRDADYCEIARRRINGDRKAAA